VPASTDDRAKPPLENALAQRREPDGTEERLSEKEKINGLTCKAQRPIPPAEVIAEAVEICRRDRNGRWHVRAPEAARHSQGIFAWDISNAEVKRLLESIWPKYVADLKRAAERWYGGDVSRVAQSWRWAFEAALDREAAARQEFGRRREKWEKDRKWSEELRRRRMPPAQRQELERKEHEVRMEAITAELDEREKGSALRALLAVKSHAHRGRISELRQLLAVIAETGSEGVTATDISHIVAPRGARLLSPEQRNRWGGEIAHALVTGGLLVASASDRFVLQNHAAAVGDVASNIP
jgi:hypothetical protein